MSGRVHWTISRWKTTYLSRLRLCYNWAEKSFQNGFVNGANALHTETNIGDIMQETRWRFHDLQGSKQQLILFWRRLPKSRLKIWSKIDAKKGFFLRSEISASSAFTVPLKVHWYFLFMEAAQSISCFFKATFSICYMWNFTDCSESNENFSKKFKRMISRW